MKLVTMHDVVEHRGKTLVVRAVRGRGKHLVTVDSGLRRRSFEMQGRFGSSLRNRAVERFVGMES